MGFIEILQDILKNNGFSDQEISELQKNNII